MFVRKREGEHRPPTPLPRSGAAGFLLAPALAPFSTPRRRVRAKTPLSRAAQPTEPSSEAATAWTTLTQYTISSNPHCPASGQQSGSDSESPTGRLAVPRQTRTAIILQTRSPWPAPLSCTGSQSQAQASFMCAAPVARAAAASTKHSPGGGSQASGSVVTAAAWATARLQASESQRRSSAKSSRPALARAAVNAAAVAGASHSPTPRTLQRLALAGASHSQ